MESHLEGIPEWLADFEDIFAGDSTVTELPPHRKYDLEIKLLDPEQTIRTGIYHLKDEDNLELRKYLQENLKNGLIRPSKSKYSSPIHIISKKN
ncbi:hypothetical protein FRC11_003193, partial [Ceratobasidium sp. 423]